MGQPRGDDELGHSCTADRVGQPNRTSGSFYAAPDDASGQPEHAAGREVGRGRGLLPGAVVGFLAAAVALGVANLVAAFVRPQASPIIAVGEAFIDRTPPALKNFAVEKFGTNDKNMLLLGMYVTIALLAMAIGCSPGTCDRGIGLGVFGLFGAFVAYTRPASRPATSSRPSSAVSPGIALIWLIMRDAENPVPRRMRARIVRSIEGKFVAASGAAAGIAAGAGFGGQSLRTSGSPSTPHR